jgi:aspartyl-tRNA(Asn)/glutamyl-tRNA(Gln) amidotransferase subunit C
VRLTPEEVEHVALLGRIKLDGDEREQFTAQLNAIFEYFEQLQQLDTAQVPPMAHAVPMQNVFREDEQAASLSTEESLDNAPDQARNSFRVPRVIE